VSRPGPATVVLLCRGCSCGPRAKHPRVDQDTQQLALEDAAVHPGVELRVVDCLDACERTNVGVLRRSGAPAKERDTWLGGGLTERATAALAGWLRDGGAAELPAPLAGLRFRRVPRRRSGRR
jgi:predicted metal-binding protein